VRFTTVVIKLKLPHTYNTYINVNTLVPTTDLAKLFCSQTNHTTGYIYA